MPTSSNCECSGSETWADELLYNMVGRNLLGWIKLIATLGGWIMTITKLTELYYRIKFRIAVSGVSSQELEGCHLDLIAASVNVPRTKEEADRLKECIVKAELYGMDVKHAKKQQQLYNFTVRKKTALEQKRVDGSWTKYSDLQLLGCKVATIRTWDGLEGLMREECFLKWMKKFCERESEINAFKVDTEGNFMTFYKVDLNTSLEESAQYREGWDFYLRHDRTVPPHEVLVNDACWSEHPGTAIYDYDAMKIRTWDGTMGFVQRASFVACIKAYCDDSTRGLAGFCVDSPGNFIDFKTANASQAKREEDSHYTLHLKTRPFSGGARGV